MKLRSLALTLTLCAAADLAARADTFTYAYTGNYFTITTGPYKTSDSVTGSLTLATELGSSLSNQSVTPLSYSFRDGVQTLSSGDSIFRFSTDASGNITNWEVYLASGSDTIESFNLSQQTDDEGKKRKQLGYDIGENGYNAGSWKETKNVTVVPPAATPEPSSFALLLTGGLGLAAALRRKRGS